LFSANAHINNAFHNQCLKTIIDVNVSSITQANFTGAIKTTGALAKAGEMRKVTEVKTRYHVDDSAFLIPFVLEMTGTFGHEADKFLRQVVKSATCHSNAGDVDDGIVEVVGPLPDKKSDESVASRNTYHSRLLWRLKERISAAVHRKNASILSTYVRKVKTVLASQH
jgi:hypothetical protein